MNNIRVAATLLLITSTSAIASGPTYGTVRCSYTQNSARVVASIVIPCGSGKCLTPSYSFDMSHVCNGNFADAQIFLSGWQWTWAQGHSHKLESFGLGVEDLKYDPTTHILNYQLGVTAQVESTSSDEGTLTLNYEIVGGAEVFRGKMGCSATNSDNCAMSAVFSKAFNHQNFSGIALTKFTMTADTSGAGTDVTEMAVDVSDWGYSYPDVSSNGSCAMGDPLNPPKNFNCDVSIAGFAGSKIVNSLWDTSPYQTPGMGQPLELYKDVAKGGADTYTFGIPRSTSPLSMLCSQSRFSLAFYDPFGGNPVDELVSWAAGVTGECDAVLTGQGVEYHGEVRMELVGPLLLPFESHQTLMGTEYN